MKKLIFVLVAAMGLSMTSYAQMSDKEMKKAIKEAQKLVKEARTDMERDDVTNKSGAMMETTRSLLKPLLSSTILSKVPKFAESIKKLQPKIPNIPILTTDATPHHRFTI